MYKKTVFAINTEKIAKESYEIAMEYIEKAANSGLFEIDLTLIMPPKTIMMFTKQKYSVTYTDDGKTRISWKFYNKKSKEIISQTFLVELLAFSSLLEQYLPPLPLYNIFELYDIHTLLKAQ